VTGLAEVVRELAGFDRRSPALIVQQPLGGYLISPDGTGGGPDNVYVISRRQLAELMWEHGIYRDHLLDPQVVARLAGLVAARRDGGGGGGS
jgi:hypothetical protein